MSKLIRNRICVYFNFFEFLLFFSGVLNTSKVLKEVCKITPHFHEIPEIPI